MRKLFDQRLSCVHGCLSPVNNTNTSAVRGLRRHTVPVKKLPGRCCAVASLHEHHCYIAFCLATPRHQVTGTRLLQWKISCTSARVEAVLVYNCKWLWQCFSVSKSTIIWLGGGGFASRKTAGRCYVMGLGSGMSLDMYINHDMHWTKNPKNKLFVG